MIHRDKYWSQAQDAASRLGEAGMYPVDVVVQCGSGLSELAQILGPAPALVPMDEIPHLPAASVSGHGHDAVFGKISGKSVLVLNGRIHIYEGHSPLTAGFPSAIAKACGAKLLLLTNSAGGLNQHYRVGDIMLHSDYINHQFDNAVAHLEMANSMDRFVDPKPAYDAALRDVLGKCILRQKSRVHLGVYIAVQGPVFETRAELAMYRSMGADGIGMSTVPEVMVAKCFGLPVVGLSVITNECFSTKPIDHKDVIQAGRDVAPQLVQAIKQFLEEI